MNFYWFLSIAVFSISIGCGFGGALHHKYDVKRLIREEEIKADLIKNGYVLENAGRWTERWVKSYIYPQKEAQ